MKLKILILVALAAGTAGYFLHPVLGEDSGNQPSAAHQFPVDNTPIDREASAVVTSYADTLEKAQPAVVAVYTARIMRVANDRSSPMEEMLRRFYGLPTPPREEEEAIEERRVPSGVGSGVIISADGYILTNHHVISDQRGNDADEILVRLDDGREFSATIVGSDERTDVALLKVEPEKELPFLRMANSDQLRVGDVVFAIGNPLGIGSTVTQGIVSATRRSGLSILDYENFIQTDAAINQGNSGGALIDAAGRLVGINTAIVSPNRGNIGIGFAIPSNLARTIMVSLLDYGEVQRGFLGVTVSDLTPDLAESFGLETTQGALVQEVPEDLPADKAGIEAGDIITEIDGETVVDATDLRLTVASILPGTEVTLTVVREGEAREFTVKLGNLDDPYGTGVAALDELLAGVTVAPVSEDIREEYGLPGGVEGLAITAVDPGSPYARGLREGMVIIEINGASVTSAREAQRVLRRGVNRFYLFDRGNYGFVAIRVP